MPQVGFKPTISAGERPQTYALERAATGTGMYTITIFKCVQTCVNRSVHNLDDHVQRQTKEYTVLWEESAILRE